MYCCDFAAIINILINMKLRIEVKETIWREIDIDTEDYTIDSQSVFEVAELINEIKNDIEGFVNENTDNPVVGQLSNFNISEI